MNAAVQISLISRIDKMNLLPALKSYQSLNNLLSWMAMANICEDKTIEKLYRKHSVQLRNYLYYRCKNLERSNDLVQEAFSKLWEKCKDIVPEAAKSFLFTVARNTMLNLIKHDRVRMEFQTNSEQSFEYETPEFKLEYDEFKNSVETIISDLPDGQREAFLLNRIDKLSYKEIAERLGISQKAVEKRMSKALGTLREKLNEYADRI